MSGVRIGILGAARIAPLALVRPALRVADVHVAAVAARDASRARAFASKHGIPKVHGAYADLVDDTDVDAVYVPLPNALHAEWATRALEAGKHVLCEKPMTSNADEARALAAVARRQGRVLMEAFHYRYHPLADRMRTIVTSGDLGDIEHIEASLCIPLPKKSDIRYDYALGGGAVMDVGCYVVNLVRFLAGAEPAVTAARATLEAPDVDRQMVADLRFPSGATGRIDCSLWGWPPLKATARAAGTRGAMHVLNPTQPKLYHRLRVKTLAGRYTEHVHGELTYIHQLRAFCDAVINGMPFPTTADDAVANMAVIDSIYETAGMRPRGT